MKYILIYVKKSDKEGNIEEKGWKLFTQKERINKFIKENNITDFEIAIPEYIYESKIDKIYEYNELLKEIGRLAMREVG